MPRGNNLVRAYECYRAGRQHKTKLVIKIYMNNHPYAWRYYFTDIAVLCYAGNVFPVRRIVTKPIMCIIRFQVGGRSKEWIAVGEAVKPCIGIVGILGMPFSPPILV